MFMTLIHYLFCGFNHIVTVFSFLFSLIHAVLPLGIDVGLVGFAAYMLTKLRKPDPENVNRIFGIDPWSKEGEHNPDKVVQCIAHRGAGLDAPENTLEAFKWCIDHQCKFVELDVRSSRDGQLVLLHDQGLERLAESTITDVRVMDWDTLKNVDIGASHPNKHKFKDVHLCLLNDAIDYLLENNVRMIIDVKGEDKQVVSGILKTFANRPKLYKYAAVTCFNPFILYQMSTLRLGRPTAQHIPKRNFFQQRIWEEEDWFNKFADWIRRNDPEIVGALSYRPYSFSAQDYNAETGPNNPRYADNLPLHAALRAADTLHSLLWRLTAKWCSVSAVLLHKDIVSPAEVHYWRTLGVRCFGWCVNRPLEKLYWRGVLKTPYLANTLVGEPDVAVDQEKKEAVNENSGTDRAGPLVDELLEPERRMSSGQN